MSAVEKRLQALELRLDQLQAQLQEMSDLIPRATPREKWLRVREATENADSLVVRLDCQDGSRSGFVAWKDGYDWPHVRGPRRQVILALRTHAATIARTNPDLCESLQGAADAIELMPTSKERRDGVDSDTTDDSGN